VELAECRACAAEAAAPVEDGLPVFAPDSAEGFDPTAFAELAGVEETSFWFAARNAVIVWAMRRHFPDVRSFLEVGCGTGYVLRALTDAFPNAHVHAVDLYPQGLEFARARVASANVAQADARSLPYAEVFDVVGAFDVVEHIDDDIGALRSLARAVRPGGGVILTVPQHPFLWSSFDVASHHQRRYRRTELEQKVRDVGLDVELSTSFVSLLLPLMAAARLSRQNQPRSIAEELRNPPSAERAMSAACRFELALVRRGVRFPAGGSRLIVARRPPARS
jgi:SAM-dependent methyltransferase